MLENATIVVGTDLTEISGPAHEAGAAIAARFGAARLVLAHGVKTSGHFIHLGDHQGRAVEAARAKLDQVDVPGVVEVRRIVRSGPPARVIVEVAEEEKAALIVVSAHGFGTLRRALIGSATMETVRAAHCPVLVVGPGREGRGPVESVSAAVDLSPVSKPVLESAADFAEAYGAPVRVVSVFEHPGIAVGEAGEIEQAIPEAEIDRARSQHREALEQALDPLRAKSVPHEVVILEGDPPSDAILRELEERPPSLLVLGTSGHDAWHRLVLGATADRLVCESSVPVLVIPSGSRAL